MRDSKRALRTAYFTALNGNITLSGRDVPVWDRVPTRQGYPYIKLAEQTITEAGGKRGCLMQEATLLLDIVTSFDGEQGGKQESDLIADQVFVILTEGTPPSMGTDFKLVVVRVDSDFDLEETSPTGYIVRRLIRFRNSIQQINN